MSSIDSDQSKINQDYVTKVLNRMVSDLISQKEFGTLPEFVTFSQMVFSKVDTPGYIASHVPFSHSFEINQADIEAMRFHQNGQEMKATLDVNVTLVLAIEELRAVFPLHIKADFSSLGGPIAAYEANVTFTLPDRTRIRYNGRHVEGTYVDRLSS